MLIFLLAPSLAWAGDDPIDTIVVPSPQGPDPLAVSAAVTVLLVDDTLPAGADVSTLVDRAPGAHVQRLGGLGDWSSVSIRGSSVRQPMVALDGVPLNPDGSATNLSEIPLAGLSRVEVWRGNAPFALGASPMGGVVDLVTGAPATTASIALGSHFTTRLSAAKATTGKRWDQLFVADAFGTRGDYAWYDDNGTLYDAGDDAIRRRANNDKAQLSGLYRAQHGRFTFLASGLSRTEGLPGHSGAGTTDARLTTARGMGVVTATAGTPDHSLRTRVWSVARRESLDDRGGEVGLSAQWTESNTRSSGVHADVAVVTSASTAFRAVLELREDHFTSASRLGDSLTDQAGRLGAAGALGADLSRGRWLVSPALQGAAFVATSGAARAPVGSVDPRVGVRYRLGKAAIRATAGSYLRAPDTLELFGDHGDLLGNPELLPERGRSADLGVVWRGDEAWCDVTSFGSYATDLIVWAQTGQRTFEARNLGNARILGTEAAGGWTHGLIDLNASATRMWSTNLSSEPAYAGNALPRTPAWDLSGTASITPGPWRLTYTFSSTAGNYWDATNWYATPARVLHGAAVRYELPSDVVIGLDLLDLGDRIVADVPANPLDPGSPSVPAAVSDFSGFPLAGRTVMFSVRWSAQ